MVSVKKNFFHLNRAFSVISKFGLIKFIFLSFLILFAVIIELISIGLVIPVLTVMQNKNFLKNYFSDNDFINNLSHSEEIYLVALLLIFVFLIKFFFLLLLNYNQNKDKICT